MVERKPHQVAPREDATEVLSPKEAQEALKAEADGLKRGTVIGQYVVEEVIGEGGGGIVYSAYDRQTGRRVAMKVPRAEMIAFPSMLRRFVREVEAVNKIRHPNIIEIYDCGEISSGRPYYVMELLEGQDLRELLAKHGRFSAKETLDLLEPVCKAVQAAHDAGILHRDIKANNVFIMERSGERVVKLLDFGIAKMMQDEPSAQGLTAPGARIGTAHNMAPEQVRCEQLDERADIYALGVVFYQLLTGQYPFHASDPRQIALLHLQAPAPRPSVLAPVPPAVDAVVLRCLEKNRDNRFQSASELIAAFRAALGELPAKSPTGESAQALGVYFELLLDAGEEMDDAMIEDIMNILDSAEQALADRGFAFPLRTSNALLGVRVIEPGANADAERAEEEAAIDMLRAMLADRPDGDPRVKVAVSLSLGEVMARSSSSGLEILGGPLLEVNSWTEHDRLPT